MTIEEEYGAELEWEDRTIAWVGDGNNMAHSWIEAATVLGFSLRLACPEGYDPHPEILSYAQVQGAKINVTRSPSEAVRGADVVTTDVWASMGQEAEADLRMRAFDGFIVNDALMSKALESAIFLTLSPRASR